MAKSENTSAINDSEKRAGLKSDVIAGGAAGNHTVTGIKLTDTLASVIHNTAGVLVDLTSEFSISAADTIENAGGTDTSGDQLMVLYESSN